MTKITFVDKNDNVIGTGTRKEALERGIIRRIVRVFLFNSKGELLIQKRSLKVPLPGKWDQSVGGHVDAGEDYLKAAQRELQEELGIRDIPLKEIAKYYTEETDEKVINKRFNMLYSANYDGKINFNEGEISEIKWIALNKLEEWIKERPRDFTQGFIDSFNIYQNKKQNDNH